MNFSGPCHVPCSCTASENKRKHQLLSAVFGADTDDTKIEYSTCTRTSFSHMENAYKSTFEPITGLRHYSSWIRLAFLCRFMSSIRRLAL